MMKKRNTLFGVALLVAVLMLGIGYALTSGPLKINGTATANTATEGFNVYFESASAGQAAEGVSSTATVTEDNKVAEMTVSLTNVGDSQTATFVVKNDSVDGLKAQLDKSKVHVYKTAAGTEVFTSDYFTVTTSWDATGVEIASGDTANLTVTVTLKKAVAGESAVTENFYVVLDEFTAVAE